MIKKLIMLGLSLFTFIATMTPIYAVDNSASVDISGSMGLLLIKIMVRYFTIKKQKKKCIQRVLQKF